MTLRLPSLPAAPRGLRRFAAIDGYRGLFVILVMLYHFGVAALAGGWVGINHFFVFSGFLIARLLVKEHSRTGRIDAVRFYLRRVRRIVPAMVILVAAVVIHAAVTQPSFIQKRVGGDALATLAFGLNWRLALRHDDYFDVFGHPSPLRHVWTLAVEEQFYVLVPFVLLAVCVLTRSRVKRAAIAFGLALASALWTAYLSLHGADQPRLYYGTDTRAQALLVGVGMGLLLGAGRDGHEPRPLGRNLTHALAWVGFLVSLSAVFILDPTSSWIYDDGGMLLFALAAALMGFAALDRRDLFINRLFGWPPLVYLGRISYGLYLYHWPIHLWLPLTSWPSPLAGAAQLLLTLVTAMVSFHLVELPIMRHGLHGLFRRAVPRRTLPLAVCAMTTAGAIFLAGTNAVAGSVPTLVAHQQPYVAPSPAQTIVAVGDSVPARLVHDFPEARFPGTRVTAAASPGCDLIDVPRVNGSGDAVPQGDQCRAALASVASKTERTDARTVLVFGTPSMAAPHRRAHGETITVGSDGYQQLVDAALDRILRRVLRGGATQMAVVTVPCRDLHHLNLQGDYRQILEQDASTVAAMEHPTRVNRSLASWVDRHDRHATLVDLHGALCPQGYRPSVHGVQLYADGVHFTPQAAGMIWGWILPQLTPTRPAHSKG